MQDPHTSQDTTRLCLQYPHRAWSLVRDTTRRTHTPLRTPHVSAYKTRTEHGRWLETLHAGHTHLSGHRTSLPTRPAQSMVAGQRRHTQDPHTFQDTARLCLQDPHRAWSLVRDTTCRTHTPLRTPHVSAYKTRTVRDPTSHNTAHPCLKDTVHFRSAQSIQTPHTM